MAPYERRPEALLGDLVVLPGARSNSAPRGRPRIGQALEHIHEGVVVVDRAWTIVDVNLPAVRLVERGRAELMGRRFWDVFPEAMEHELGQSYLEAMRTRTEQHVEAFYGPLHGWFDVRAVPIENGLALIFHNANTEREAAATQQALVARLEAALATQNHVQSVIVAFAEALSVEAVAAATSQLAKAALGTMFAGVALSTDDRFGIQFVSLDPLCANTNAVWTTVGLDADSMLADCIRLGQPTFHASRTELLATYPHLASTVETSRDHAFASAPMLVGRRVVGGLAMSWSSERIFSEQDRTYVRMLAAQCAQAVQRVQLVERQRDVAETLQQAMLPDEIPEMDRVSISACYMPATTDLTVGGDWYDAFALPDGRLAFAVGDVSGHGLQAAAVMGQVRTALRAYLVEGHDPASALTRLDELVQQARFSLFATVIAAVYDPATGELIWANGGHPPLIVRTATSAHVLEGHVGAPIGVGGPAGYVAGRTTIAIGEIVLGYTDGLIERRHEDLDVGIDRLLGCVKASAASVAGDIWCHELVTSALGDRPREDDICTFVVQRLC